MNSASNSMVLAHSELQRFALKEIGILDVHIDTRLIEAARNKGITHILYCIFVGLSRKHNEDEDKLYILITHSFITLSKTYSHCG